jgi:L-amino acid N-acyltransferase YncA
MTEYRSGEPSKANDMTLSFLPMNSAHWDDVGSIYQEGIDTGLATFETEAPSWEEWDASHLQKCRLVAVEDNAVLGWAALSPVSDRCALEGVAEVSVYIAASARGRGVGKATLRELISESEKAGIWTLQAGLFAENEASLAIHESCGFREVGVRRRLGRLNGVWRDVLLLERRSEIVGV